MLDFFKKKVRVRFAPSPTGYLHVGGLRTALYNYIFAKKSDGDFILRIEDTDRSRYVEDAIEKLIVSFEWAGLCYSEGIFSKKEAEGENVVESKSYPGFFEIGKYGPYAQSERLEIYKKYAQQLVEEGKAYYCFCESERLEEMRKKQQDEKKAPMYDRYCLENLTQEQINEKLKQKCPATIRMKVPQGEEIIFEDVVRGKVSFNTNNIDDQVLLKSDGFPTYHLANVIDDHLMEITHVLRAEEWLPSTPKHILLYKAFDWDIPIFAHLPQLLSVDKKKLSKRMGDVAVEDYVKKGYLKEAIINFVALLGWNPGEGSTQEIFSMEELIDQFDLAKVHKAGAVFDIKKLDWLNAQYIKKMDINDIYQNALKYFKEKEFFKNAPEERKTEEYLKKVLTIEKDRLVKFSDVGEGNEFFFGDVACDKELLRWKEMSDEDLKKSLETSKNILEKISDENWTLENLEEKLLEAAGEKRGDLLWPLRAVLTGEKKSPSPFEVAWILGKNESLNRISKALKLL